MIFLGLVIRFFTSVGITYESGKCGHLFIFYLPIFGAMVFVYGFLSFLILIAVWSLIGSMSCTGIVFSWSFFFLSISISLEIFTPVVSGACPSLILHLMRNAGSSKCSSHSSYIFS